MSLNPYIKLFLLGAVIAVLGIALYEYTDLSSSEAAALSDAEAVIYQNPACGCCSDWAYYLEDEGFSIDIREVEVSELDQIRADLGVPQQTRSCHTAQIGDYVVEGHVPAEDIRRLLNDRPNFVGIAVPGMPVGSPGMEGAYEEPYDVYAFDDQGQLYIFAEHRP